MQLLRQASRLELYMPLLLICCTSLFAVVVSVISLMSGWLTIFQNLFYIPIILACIYYTRRGFLFSVLLSCLYLAMMLLFSRDLTVIEGALIRVAIFIVVAVVITLVTEGRLHAEEALRESEARYSALFDNNYSVSLLIDPDTAEIVEANEAACQYYGYSHEQMLAMAITDLNRLPREKVVSDLQRAKNEGKKHFFSTHYLAGGERRDVEVYSGPITLQGKPLFYSVIHDITARKEAEEALRESEKRYRDFFTTSRDSVFITTPEGRWIDFNDTALEMFGYRSRAELMGLPLPDLYEHPEERKELLRLIATNNYVRDYPVRLRRRDGSVIDTLVTSVPLREGDGSITAFIGSIRDITEAKQAEEALRESEERFRAIVEQSSDVVFITDETGVITYISPVVAMVFGYEPAEMEGTLFTAFLPPEEIPRAGSAFQAVVRTGVGATDFHLQMRRKDGSVFTAELRGARYASDGFSGTVGTIRDITERKRIEKEIADRERFLQQLLETIPNPIYYKDRDGRYTGCNSAFAAFLGVDPGRVAGSSVYDLSPRDLADLYYAKDRQLIDQPGKQTYEAQVQYADGSRHDVIFNKATLMDETGGTTGIVGIMVDITERKRAEEALRMANRKLNLLGSITRHDILNQLLVVNGYLELLGEKVPGVGLELYISRVTTATARIEAMIRFTKAYEQVGVHAPAWQAVRNLVDADAKDAVGGHIRLHNDLSPGTEVYADPLIAKVFYNLVDNAVRHGEKVTTVRFFGSERDGGYVITCEDDGAGVPAGEKEKIFERGYGKHTGFGLFLAREILSITGITIAETGEEGKGARFDITVPKGGYRYPGQGSTGEADTGKGKQVPGGSQGQEIGR